MNLTLDEIREHIDGTLNGQGSLRVRGYSIDSRSILPGELFFAIRGPRFDGHEFASQAQRAGASGVVVCHGEFESGPGFGVLRVADPAAALRKLARAVRRLWKGTVVGVTGSVGKTTTKEMIAAVLGRKFTVLRSIGNLNNEYGLPLCLLRVEPFQSRAVLEMGMSARGEIRKLASIAEPNEGVVTNVNPVHLEFFKSVDEIAEAKAELIESLVPPKVAYLNNDDSRVRAMARRTDARIVTFAVKGVAAFRVKQMQDLGLDGTAFTVHHGRRDVNFVLPLLGQHNVANAVSAIGVGITHGVSWEEARNALSEMKPERMRGEVVRFREGFAVVDDTYNSNPKALIEMIRFLGRLKDSRRRILVAGEMLELGPEGPSLHEDCGSEAARAGIDVIVGVRGLARNLLAGARSAGMSSEALHFAPDAAEAGNLLARFVQKGDVVLMKASRGVRLEQALNTLRLSFSAMEP